MGLILDSSVLIKAERQGKNAHQALAEVTAFMPGVKCALSVISVFELNHGAFRAQSTAQRTRRRHYLNEFTAMLPVHAVTVAIALRAGQIDGELTPQGTRIAMADLLIGVTALELGYRILMGNMRHFRMIPGLEVLAVQ